VLNSLQWSLTPQVSFQLGHRWERVDVASAIVGISTDELAIVARYPTRTTISAPFAQLSRDTRDNAFDPTRGTYSAARVEFANQLFLTSANSSFVKLDLKHQWTWPVGYRAKDGVVALGLHLGIAKPTASSANNLPLSERFFAGGPFSFRGVEPDALGVQTSIPLRYTTGSQAGQEELDANGLPITYKTPVGGQALALINLEYRFPLVRPSVWGEVFVDSGQVYESISRQPAQPGVDGAASTPATGYPPFRTALGLGLIFKIGIPLKIEYAQDVSRILGRPRSQDDVDTQLKSVLISAGFQF
jgi:outer membrane protein assembly factor BamA